MIAALLLAALVADDAITLARNESLVHHHRGALEAVEKGISCTPEEKILWDKKIATLAALGDKKPLLAALKQYDLLFPADNNALEQVAWALIKSGMQRAVPAIRMRSLYMAAVANDRYSVEILLKGLSDNQLPIRLFSIYLASHFLDAPLQKRLEELFLQDRAPEARVQAAAGLRLQSSLPVLQKQLEAADSFEEKESAIRAILALTKKIERREIEALTQSKKPEFRELAARLIIEHYSRDTLDCIAPLLSDPAERVKIACLNAYAVLQKETFFDVQGLLEHQSSAVQSAALFYLIRMGKQDPSIEKKLYALLTSSNRDIRLEVTARLLASGKEGAPLSEKCIERCEDPLVRINLAMHLIRERQSVDKAAKILRGALKQIEERLSFENDLVVASKTVHVPYMPRYPETLDLLARLRLSCILATVSSGDLGAILRDFIKERNASIVGLSAALFIQEYDESGIEEIRGLLQDPSFEVRMEAAIILGLMAQDEEALKTLYEAFGQVSSDLQEEIIYAVGAISAKSSLPFLIACLHNEREILQIAAAGSILQCLNR